MSKETAKSSPSPADDVESVTPDPFVPTAPLAPNPSRLIDTIFDATERPATESNDSRLERFLHAPTVSQALAESAVEQVEVHLDDCPSCKHLHDQMKQADPSTLFRKATHAPLVALASTVR